MTAGSSILVTGGAGFIGSHTADALLRAGHRVRVLDAFLPPVHPPGAEPRLDAEVEVIHGDVRDRRAWERALEGVDAVYHFAAYQDYMPDFGRFFHVNSVGTALLYEVAVARGLDLAKVVVASSQAVYGEGGHECRSPGCDRRSAVVWPGLRGRKQLDAGDWEHRCESCGEVLTPLAAGESRTNPQNQYALSKHHQETIALSLGGRYDIPTVALRYSIVQGPRQSFHNTYSGAARIFCLCAYHGRPCTIYEDGRQRRDYVNVDDVVDANLLVLSEPAADGRALNVSGGHAHTVLELAEQVPAPLEWVVPGEYRYGDTRHIVSDVTEMRRLGWEPRRTPADSLRAYLDWLADLDDVPDVLEQGRRAMLSGGVVRRASAGAL